MVAAVAAMLLVACSQTSYPTSEPYPDSRYPYPDSRTYPSDYPREGQRDGIVTIIRVSDNYNNNYEHLPPGQAKKRYGGRSARIYAPGQQNRNGGYRIATVIAVPDRYASRSNSGQFYYNYRSNTYWKRNDGYYYIDNTYRR